MLSPLVKHRSLRLAIRGSGMTQDEVARSLGISVQALRYKLSGSVPWKMWEAYKLIRLLGKEPADIPELFPEDDQALLTDMSRKGA